MDGMYDPSTHTASERAFGAPNDIRIREERLALHKDTPRFLIITSD